MRVILIYLAVMATLFAQGIEHANERFDKAKESYQDKLFSDTYDLLIPYTKEGKLSKDLSFILARSAYEVGRYGEAEELYEKLLLAEPANSRLRYELAQSCFKQNKLDRAKGLYEEVLKDSSLPPKLRSNIELLLLAIEKKQQKHLFKTALSIGFGYDSNVDNITNDEYVYWGNLPLRIGDRKSDHFMEYIASVSHSYKLQNNLSIDSKLVGYKQKYNHQDHNDLDLIILGSGVSYYTTRAKYSLGFEFNHISLDNDTYLRNYILTPSLDYQVRSDLIYKAKLRVIKKEFKQGRHSFRDSLYIELANGISHISQDYGINSATMTLGTDNRDGSKHYNVDYNFISFRLANIYPLTKDLVVSSGVEYYLDRYKAKESVLYGSKKRDDKFSLDLGAIYSFYKGFAFGASLRYIDNDSNQNIYEYDKYVIKTNLSYSF